MMSTLDETFFFYRHKCGFDVLVDVEDQRVVLPIDKIGAIIVPTELVPESISPVIRHPGGQRCTILTDGDSGLTKAFRARLQRAGISTVDPGSWVALPMLGAQATDPEADYMWTPGPLEPPVTLPRPSTVYAALNSTLAPPG
jgi:hypothetical protein